MSYLRIGYTKGYKYQLSLDYSARLGFAPPQKIDTEYVKFDIDGTLWIKEGYAWDGPSGPTYDSRDSMRPSLVHDALYQLMRENLLDHDEYRELADKTFRSLCLEDGMCTFRAWVWYQGVRIGAASAADPKNDRKVIWAPK